MNPATQYQYNEKFVLAILALVQFVNLIDFMIMMPLGPQLIKLFEITPAQFGFLISAYTLSGSITSLLGSFIMDRYDRKKLLMFLLVGFSFATLLCGLSFSFALLLLSRCLTGIFGGMMYTVVFSILADLIPEERRGAATGVVMSAFSLSTVIGVPLGIFISSHLNWNSPFLFLAAFGLIILFCSFKIIPPINKHLAVTEKQNPWEHFKIAIMIPNHQRLLLFSSSLMMAGFTVIPYLSTYNVDNVKISNHDLTYLYLCGGICTFFTSRWFGKLSDKYGKHFIFMLLASLSMIPVLISTHLPESPLYVAIGTGCIFMIFVSGRFVPGMALITSSIDPKYRGSFMSINTSLQQVAQSLAVLIAGLMITQDAEGRMLGYDYAGFLACGMTLIAIFLSRGLKTHLKEI